MRRESGDGQQHAHHPDECDGVLPSHPEEQAAQHSCSEPRCDEADGDPEQRRPDALSNHHARDVVGLGAERDPDTDLAGALRRGVGHDTVQADRGEQQGDAREDAEECGIEPRRRPGIADDALHGGHFVERERWIEAGHDTSGLWDRRAHPRLQSQ